MKKSFQWITTLAASAVVAVGAPAFADVGRVNVQDQSGNTNSAQTRAKLRAEMDAAEQAEMSHGDAGVSYSSGASVDGRGAAGSGSSPRMSDEVRAKLGKSSRANRDQSRDDVYRPN